MNSIRIEIGEISIFVEGDYDFIYDDGVVKLLSKKYPSHNSNVAIPEVQDSSTQKEITQDPIYDMEKIRMGGQVLYGLVETWKINFDSEGEQPNRMQSLIDAMLNHGDEIILLLKFSEGLTNAIIDLFPPMPDANEIQLVDHAKFYRKIACNLAQISSVSMSELSDYLEPHSNYLQQKFWW